MINILILFTQLYNGLDVIDSRLYVKQTKNNEVVVFGLELFNDIDMVYLPSLKKLFIYFKWLI